MESAEQEAQIGELEQRVERLRSMYEQYFMGIEKLEPSVLRKDVERRFWILRREQLRNTALRFKLNMVTQRYNTFQQYWQRLCREIENGTFKRDVRRTVARFGADLLTAQTRKRFGKLIERLEADGAVPDESWDVPVEIDMDDEPDAGVTSPIRIDRDALRKLEQEAERADIGDDFGQIDNEHPSGSRPGVALAPRGRADSFGLLDDDDDDDDEDLGRPTAPAPARDKDQGAGRIAPAPPPPPQDLFASTATDSQGSTPSPTPTPTPVRLARFGARAPVAPPSAPQASGGAKPMLGILAKPRAPQQFDPENEPPRDSSPGQTVGHATDPAPPPVPSVPPPPGRPPPPTKFNLPPVAPPPRKAARPAPSAADARAARVPEPRPAGADSALSESRVRQIYDQYIKAKHACREVTDSITVTSLAAQLRRSAEKLSAQHGREVDFDVVIKNGKAILKPKVKS